MIGVILFLVFVGVALRIVYGLRHPHFWLFAGVVVLLILPMVLVMAVLGQSLHIG